MKFLKGSALRIKYLLSLEFLCNAFDVKGYVLVGCDLSGSNAFFVRKDLISDHFCAPYTAEHHYEPPRYHLCSYTSGHPSTYASVKKVLESWVE